MIRLSAKYCFVFIFLLEILTTVTSIKNKGVIRQPKLLDVNQFLADLHNNLRNITLQNQIDNQFLHRDWNKPTNFPVSSPTPSYNSNLGSNESFIPSKPSYDNGNFVIIDKPSGPQSFTLLMNFQTDGTSLVKILKGNTLFWNDNGYCTHGKVYDPSSGFCRDVFCSQGYTLSNNGCILEHDNSQLIKPTAIHDEITVELTVVHRLCLYAIGFNETGKCDHEPITNTDYFLAVFKVKLKTILGVSTERLDEMKMKSRVLINEKLNENYTATSERVEISFVIRDNKKFENDNIESVTLYFWIISLTMERKNVDVLKHEVAMVKVVEETDSTLNDKWCSSDTERALFFDNKDAFRVLASFDSKSIPKYYIFIKQSESLYETGDFKLSIIYIPIQTANVSQLVDENKYFGGPYIHWDPLRNIVVSNSSNKNTLVLKDVTDIVLENNQNVKTEILLHICNHRPKIVEPCLHHETVRVGRCELTKYHNRSYCSKIINQCYSTNQYETDELEPLKYIRICKYEIIENHKIVNNIDRFWNISTSTSNDSILSEVSGWLSTIAIGLSIIFMIATLLTYALFKELRNIPGWNIINLTLALLLAQFFFFLGSFIKQTPLACFVVAIITHYGFLASFCWMNVIAFDLYRNFRQKAVLLKRIKVKERLPQYAVFGWLLPILFIIMCVLVDVFAANAGPYRPCYAGYLNGCLKLELSQSNYQNVSTNSTNFNPITKSSTPNNLTDTVIDSCNSFHSESTVLKYVFLSRTCWISNGMANLVYFGLPIALIIIINGILFFLTIYNIRTVKRSSKKSIRKFSRVKAPLDRDVKFYIQMGVIMGFTWIIGFFLTSLSNADVVILQILVYLFIVSNASQGIFIFFVFIFKKETLSLYKQLGKKYFPKLIAVNKSETQIKPHQASQESMTISKQESSSTSTSDRTQSTNTNKGSLRSVVSIDFDTPLSKPDSIFFTENFSKSNKELDLSEIPYIED